VGGRKERKRKIRDEVGKGKSDKTKNPNTCRRRRGKSGEKRLRTGNRYNIEKLLQINGPEFIIIY